MVFFIGYQLRQSNMEEIIFLENKIREHKAWISARKDRLSYPLDSRSKLVIQKDMLVFTGKTQPAITDLLTDLTCLGLEVSINGRKRAILASLPLYPFTAATSDVITYSAGSFILKNNDVIALTSSNTLPAGLSVNTEYYIINATTNTFKVSLTQGGAAVDITDTGSGSHYFAIL